MAKPQALKPEQVAKKAQLRQDNNLAATEQLQKIKMLMKAASADVNCTVTVRSGLVGTFTKLGS